MTLTPDPTVTVLVCAYTLDRWDDLGRALRSVAGQEPAPHETLLVVDHNPELLERAVAEMPHVTVVPNHRRRGLAGARNTGIDVATGDLVAFLDDDATAPRGWLPTLVRHFRDPTVLAVGGAARPGWPRARPLLYPAAAGADHGELDWVVGCSYRGQPEVVSEVRNVIGCTMAFRRDAVVAVGGFLESLGRTGTRPVGCEETELCIRLAQHRPDGRIVLDPSCPVHHRVGPDRVRWSYLVSRCFAEGMSKRVVTTSVGSTSGLSTERGYVAHVLPAAVKRELGVALHGRPGALVGAAALVVAPAAALLGYVTHATTTAWQERRPSAGGQPGPSLVGRRTGRQPSDSPAGRGVLRRQGSRSTRSATATREPV